MNEASVFEALMRDKSNGFEIKDEIEQAYRQGFEAGQAQHEEKHWNECRQISEYQAENKALKEMLKQAIGTINEFACGFCMCCKNHDNEQGRCTLDNGCADRDNWAWAMNAEAMKLIGGGENG